MDHSDDEDSEFPPSANQQQLAQYWEASQQYAAPQQQGQIFPAIPAGVNLPQQHLAAAAAASQAYPSRQSVPGMAGYPMDVAVSAVAPGAVDPYQRQRHQQLLYQQQMAAYAAAQQQSAIVGRGQPPALQFHHHQAAHLPPAAYYSSQLAAERPGQQLHHHPQIPAGYLQPSPQVPPQPAALPQFQRVRRIPSERPLIKLSVSLIDTYKNINTAYYEDRDARRAARAKEKKQTTQDQAQGVGGTNNNGWDDDNFDYIVTQGEIFYNRYKIKERIGKGSFGQVVRAEDTESHAEVAIKIIKSKKPFLMQAKTEIELLTHLWEKDPDDQHNIVRLLTHFMYRNHQCLVFEMLSLNLYELLKNTQFGGVSLNLIRKFGKQVLKALAFLAKSDVDIIHCDLKPENILLRHPKKSGVKVIDFGSSCRSNKRMYSYIQSRFYRSPEVMLGLPYSVAIDMWSLGCILAEMHTGEPLFSGSDQFDQMQKIVKLLGMVPSSMLERSSESIKLQFFQSTKNAAGYNEWRLRQTKQAAAASGKSETETTTEAIVPSTDPIASLKSAIVAGNRQKKKFPMSETYNSARNYELFVDLVYRMLAYRPEDRITPEEAMSHPFIVSGEHTSG